MTKMMASSVNDTSGNETGDGESIFAGLTVVKLKNECKKRKLKPVGRKADLVKLLEEYDRNKVSQDEKETKGSEEPAEKRSKPEEETRREKPDNNATSESLEDSDETPKPLEKQSTLLTAAAALVSAGSFSKKVFKPDPRCPLIYKPGCKVYQDYDCMLHRTDLTKNSNQYYVLQLLQVKKEYYCWVRWGRVGDPPKAFNGQYVQGPFDRAKAVETFKNRFWMKTGTVWKEPDNPSKPENGGDGYIKLEMGDEEEDRSNVVVVGDKIVEMAPSTLDSATRKLVEMIFDEEMLKNAMVSMKFDTRKMPLGKLSRAQIAKGLGVLNSLRDEIDLEKNERLAELTNSFYTAVPHDYGWDKPPIITTREMVMEKMDNLLILNDIELAMNMRRKADGKNEVDKEEKLQEHIADKNYKSLECDLNLMIKEDPEYKVVETYFSQTMQAVEPAFSTVTHRRVRVNNIWKVNRPSEGERFKQHDDLENRKLLFHGTSLAVVAAIMKTGLRIMPARCPGLYHASQASTSFAYMRWVVQQKKGVMFVNEVILGKSLDTSMGCAYIQPQPGYDSVVWRGRVEPDESLDTTIRIENHDVIVPQGPAVPVEKWKRSTSTSEYIVHKESQVRIRYALELEIA